MNRDKVSWRLEAVLCGLLFIPGLLTGEGPLWLLLHGLGACAVFGLLLLIFGRGSALEMFLVALIIATLSALVPRLFS